LEIWPEVTEATEVWITEAVIVEIGNALSAVDREKATIFINGVYENPAPNLRLETIICDRPSPETDILLRLDSWRYWLPMLREIQTGYLNWFLQ